MFGRKKKTPRHTKNRSGPEFSKVVSVIGIIMWIVVNGFGMVMIARTFDLSPLVYIIGSADTVVSVILGFYFWKAKAENQIKLRKQYGDMAKEDSSFTEEQWK